LFAGYCYRRAFELEGSGETDLALPTARCGGTRRAAVVEQHQSGAKAGKPLPCRETSSSGGGPAAITSPRSNTKPTMGSSHTIEGDVGRYPAKVKRLVHDVTKEPHFRGVAGLR
jgi:hypothetical protein